MICCRCEEIRRISHRNHLHHQLCTSTSSAMLLCFICLAVSLNPGGLQEHLKRVSARILKRCVCASCMEPLTYFSCMTWELQWIPRCCDLTSVRQMQCACSLSLSDILFTPPSTNDLKLLCLLVNETACCWVECATTYFLAALVNAACMFAMHTNLTAAQKF
jgi:hypothetical protein